MADALAVVGFLGTLLSIRDEAGVAIALTVAVIVLEVREVRPPRMSASG
jgi:hypothetical protein